MKTDIINYRNLHNATVGADNSADNERAFDISADLYIEGSNLTAVNNGLVTALPATGIPHAPAPDTLCTFSHTQGGILLNYTSAAPDSNVAVLEAVKAFIAATSAKVAEASPLGACFTV